MRRAKGRWSGRVGFGCGSWRHCCGYQGTKAVVGVEFAFFFFLVSVLVMGGRKERQRKCNLRSLFKEIGEASSWTLRVIHSRLA